MKKIISALLIALLMLGLCSCGEEKTNDEGKNVSENVENNTASLSMEKITAGSFTFMVPDNGDTKFADGETMQNFYFENGDTGVVWYSVDGPLNIPQDEDEAHDITSSLGEIVEFKHDEKNGFEQATILNKYEDEYQGVRLINNTSDNKECIWLSVTGTDKKVIKTILDSLTW